METTPASDNNMGATSSTDPKVVEPSPATVDPKLSLNTESVGIQASETEPETTTVNTETRSTQDQPTDKPADPEAVPVETKQPCPDDQEPTDETQDVDAAVSDETTAVEEGSESKTTTSDVGDEGTITDEATAIDIAIAVDDRLVDPSVDDTENDEELAKDEAGDVSMSVD